MCYRFYIDLFFKKRVKKEFSDKGILVPDGEFTALSEPRDVYPSEKALVIAGSRGALSAESMGWGFSNPVSKGLLANARSESIKEKPTFRESAFLRRCAIPASGFYEWDEYKARYKFFRTDEELLWLAGIYRMENGLKRFTVLTREAAGPMISVHPRMPVTLSGFEINTWISDAGFMDDLFSIEHNMEIIKCADHVIDLGPDGGDKGGNLVIAGTPEEVARCHDSLTGYYLKDKLT